VNFRNEMGINKTSPTPPRHAAEAHSSQPPTLNASQQSLSSSTGSERENLSSNQSTGEYFFVAVVFFLCSLCFSLLLLSFSLCHSLSFVLFFHLLPLPLSFSFSLPFTLAFVFYHSTPPPPPPPTDKEIVTSTSLAASQGSFVGVWVSYSQSFRFSGILHVLFLDMNICLFFYGGSAHFSVRVCVCVCLLVIRWI